MSNKTKIIIARILGVIFLIIAIALFVWVAMDVRDLLQECGGNDLEQPSRFIVTYAFQVF